MAMLMALMRRADNTNSSSWLRSRMNSENTCKAVKSRWPHPRSTHSGWCWPLETNLPLRSPRCFPWPRGCRELWETGQWRLLEFGFWPRTYSNLNKTQNSSKTFCSVCSQWVLFRFRNRLGSESELNNYFLKSCIGSQTKLAIRYFLQ